MSSRSAREELRRGLWPDKEPLGSDETFSGFLPLIVFALVMVTFTSSVVALSLVTPEWIP